MKRILVSGLLLLTFAWADGQILHPVKWAYGVKKTGAKEATVYLKATIEDGWHIYSAYQKDGGPVKTSFIFLPAKNYQLIGNIAEPPPITRFEEAFKMDVGYFQDSVIF